MIGWITKPQINRPVMTVPKYTPSFFRSSSKSCDPAMVLAIKLNTPTGVDLLNIKFVYMFLEKKKTFVYVNRMIQLTETDNLR